MTHRTCLVDDCEREAGEPGSGRGWCSLHYQRWRRTGDPTAIKRRRNTCTIDGCDLLVTGRGWCSKHYTRWLRYSKPDARIPGEVVDDKRICPTCRIDVPLTGYGASKRICLKCIAAKRAEWRVANPHLLPKAPTFEATCENCGTVFAGTKRQYRNCSPECAAARKNVNNWPHMVARRARLRDAFVEKFDRIEIFERDGWVCQLCGHSIDPALTKPHPRSASLDHIHPISRGGLHERSNAQTACLGCNVKKGATVA